MTTPDHYLLLSLGGQSNLVELFPMAAYAVRAPDGVIVWFNSRAAELWGRTPVLGDTEERFCGAHKLYRPDGSSMAHANTPVALALRTGLSFHDEEIVIERPDSSRVTVSVHIDPVRDSVGKIIGAVNFFEEVTERKVRPTAAQSQLERHAASLGASPSQLMHWRDTERRRVSGELHDVVFQQLAAAKLNLTALTKRLPDKDPLLQRLSDEARVNLDDAAKELRSLSYMLHPPLLLDKWGFAGAVHWWGEDFSRRSGIALEVSIPADLPEVSSEREIALFRIVQESLSNVHCHSGARKASVTVAVNGDLLHLEVADNGQGIRSADPAASDDGTTALGIGIQRMHECVREFHGTLEIRENSPGTRVIATLPLNDKKSATVHRPIPARSTLQ